MIRWMLGVLLLAGLASCSKTSEVGNHPPQITFISVTPQEFSITKKDSVSIAFRIDDKDGDVGSEDDNSPTNLFIKLGEGDFGEAKLPVIPKEYRNPETGFHGTTVVKIPAVRLSLDSLHAQTGDTLNFQLFILDIAGNRSDTITTPEVYLRP